jgi:hypothetical protein
MKDERLSRLEAMLADGFGTWDLSEKDKDAIRWAVRQLRLQQSGNASLLMTIAQCYDALDEIVKAATPFAIAASGVPDNWPESCVLTFDAEPANREIQHINYLRETDHPAGPTIGQWRHLAKVRDEIFDSFGSGAK